mgnify:CR=1 FL=1
MKRLFAFLLACVLLCACSACKKESPPAPEPAQTAKADPEQTISGLSVRIPATQYRLGRTEPELLDLGEHLLPYDKGAVLTGMIFAQDEAENDTEAAAFYAPDRSCVVQTLAVSPDGRVVQAALDGERLFSLEAAGEDGTPWALHGTAMESSRDAALTGCSNITAMAVREDTVYLAADGACVLACSLDGALLWKQEAPTIDRFFSAQDGRLLAWARQEQVLYLLEDGAIRRLCSMPDLFCTGIEQLYPGDQTPYDCIVCANDAFFGWSIAEEAVTQLFTCDAVGLYAGDILDFCSLGNDRYLGFEWAPSASGEPGCTLFWLTPVEGKLPEKRTIRVAGSRSSIFSMAVRDFSSLYPEYQVEFVDYDAQYGEQADQQLLMDLLYGDCPDLLFVNGLPFAQYARQGLLEDLYPWIDADETLSRADFTQNLLHALETDDALYRLPQTYMLATAAGLPEIVGGHEAWSMADFLDTAQAHPEISSVFAQDDGISMLQLLLLYAPDAFVDYDAAKARFDSPDFLCLLELAKRQKQPEAESPREALLTGQTLLEQLMISRAQYFEEEYADGLNQLAFPGFPGAGRASFYLTLPMAIPVNAQEKEGAWAFLKLLMTEPLYAARSRGGWLPVQSDFEKKTEAMTDPDAQCLLRELQAEAVSVFEHDAAVNGILADELPYYFAEEQSAGQIADRIQRRVQLYLEETRR